MASTQKHENVSVKELFDLINDAVSNAKSKLDVIRAQGDQICIGDIFEMQFLMNKLSQLSDMTTNTVSALHQAAASMTRNIK